MHLDLHDRAAEHTGLPDHSVDTVISSLVLCSVHDPAAVLAEIRRILRPGGTYRFVEHVAARAAPPPAPHSGSFVVRGPGPSKAARANATWSVMRAAGFASVDIDRYRLTLRSSRSTPTLPESRVHSTRAAGLPIPDSAFTFLGAQCARLRHHDSR